MILTKTPFRVSFVGGGSDLPAFYRRHVGTVVSTTIDKSLYIAVHSNFDNRIHLKYARIDEISSGSEIQHPLVRECLRMVNLDCGMEIASIADIPAGTGMGSSSAFTVGLMHALHVLSGREPSKSDLAEAACQIELERLRAPIGKQDQYSVAYGGLNCIRFYPHGGVEVCPISCSTATRAALEQRLMLFYVGQERDANSVLEEQARNMADSEKFGRVAEMARLAEEMRTLLERDEISCFGEILHQSWILKSGVARNISNETINNNYLLARDAGAQGGKLLGAGGGGFLLLFCETGKQSEVRRALAHLKEICFKMTVDGSRVMCDDGRNDAILNDPAASSLKSSDPLRNDITIK
jgi:D-glycero-alpha-D-manno-heptose-7-phosphate kinase